MKYLKILYLILFVLLNFNCKKDKETIALKGFINFINGDIKIILENGNTQKAKVGDEVCDGMKIETIGDKSFVDIYFDQNIVKVLGNTSVEIKKLRENIMNDTRVYKFHVGKGSLFSRVKVKLAKGDLYQVTTPTTTAGVRGTDFLVTEEDGKANVACLSGLVSVLNNTMTDSKPVVLESKKETDVLPKQDMIIKQISGDKLRMLNIIAEIKEMREDIRRKFEEQREEIRKHVVEQKEKNKAMLEEQIEKDKALVLKQKEMDKERIEEIKGKTKEMGREAVDEAKQKIEETKVDKEAVKKIAEEKKKSVKPKIEKFKFNKDQFKEKAKE